MLKLVWDASFRKSYKKRISKNPQLKKKFWDSLEVFVHSLFDQSLRTHKLTGKLNGLWSLSVDDDCRVVFKFMKNNEEVLLIDIGSHEEVY